MWRLSRRGLLLLGGGGGRGSLPSRQNAEAPPPGKCVCVREAGGRGSLETEVEKSRGAAKVERVQRQPEHALHATVPCPACGGGALPAGPLRQPGKASPRVLPSAVRPPGGHGAGGLPGRLAPPLGDPRVLGVADGRRGSRPPVRQGIPLCCRRGVERQVARASGEGASPAPCPAMYPSESGPVAARQGRCRVLGSRGASDRPRPTCRGGGVPGRSRGETWAGEARGWPSSESRDVGESQLTTGRY